MRARPITNVLILDYPLDRYPEAPEHPQELTWEGASGQHYKYFLYPIAGAEFDVAPSNFIFCRMDAANEFCAVYVGETENMQLVLDDHHIMRRMKFNKANYVFVHRSHDDPEMRQIEKADLIARLKPICNR